MGGGVGGRDVIRSFDTKLSIAREGLEGKKGVLFLRREREGKNRESNFPFM